MSEVILAEQTNTRLTINPITRLVAPKYRNTKAVYVAKGDKNSVCLAFEIPRYVDGYDMSAEGNVIHIHFANMDGEDKTKVSKGFSEAKSITVERDEASREEVVSFLWVLPEEATRYAGLVSFGITFERYDVIDGKAQEVYSWSTKPYSKTIVWDSMDNSKASVEREYDYLVDTINAIVSKAMESKVTEAEGILNEKISNASEEIDSKVTEVGRIIASASEEIDSKVTEAEKQALLSKANASLSEEHEENAKVTAEALKNTLSKAGNAIALASSLEKGEAENSLRQVGCVVQSGLALSNQEIKYVSFSYETNLLTVTTNPDEDGTYFFDKEENLVYGFKLNNVNTSNRPIVDIVAVIRESETDRGYTRTEVNGVPQWTFLIVSPLEMLDFDTPSSDNSSTSLTNIHALLFDDTIKATSAVALGLDSYALNKGAITFGGYKCTAGGEYSFAGGWGAFTMGRAALAFGYNVGVLENYGVVLGSNARAGYGAFAVNNGTNALGRYSTAFNKYTKALGEASFAANEYTQARKQGSASFGNRTIANTENQIVNGKYNIIDENEEFAEITGNGTGLQSRSNARTLDWQGNEWLAGRVRVGADKELLPTKKEVETMITEEVGALSANALKKTVSGNLVRLEDVSPLQHKIKAKSTTSDKVIATSKNLLDLNRSFLKTNCTVLDSNSIRTRINNTNYATLYPKYLHNLLQQLDGQTITLSIAKGTEGRVGLYIKYAEGGGKEKNSNPEETSVSLKLDHQGKTIEKFEIRLHRKYDDFTDTETVIQDIQLEISEAKTGFVKPHSEIYQIVDMVDGECEVNSLGTAMTIIPDSIGAEIEVKYNAATKKIDSAMSDTSENPVQNKVIKAYVDEAINNIKIPEPSSITVDNTMSDTSTNPIQNKAVKQYVDDAIENIEIPLSMITVNHCVLSALNWVSTTDELGQDYHFIDIFDIALPSSNNITIEMDMANDASITERKAAIEASLFVTTSPDNAIRVIALTKPVIDIPVNMAIIYKGN